MRIHITPANRDKLAAAIAEAEGRATARTLDVDDLAALIAEVEQQLYPLRKKHWRGIVADVSPGHTVANSYGNRAYQTAVTIEYTGRHWTLTDVYRVSAGTSPYGTGTGKRVHHIILTPAHADLLAAATLNRFHVADTTVTGDELTADAERITRNAVRAHLPDTDTITALAHHVAEIQRTTLRGALTFDTYSTIARAALARAEAQPA